MILFFKGHGYDLFRVLLSKLAPVHKVATFPTSSGSSGKKYQPGLTFGERLGKVPAVIPEFKKQRSDVVSPTAGLVR